MLNVFANCVWNLLSLPPCCWPNAVVFIRPAVLTLPPGVGYFRSVTNEDAVFVLLVGARYYFLVVERQADHLFSPWCCSFRAWRRYQHWERSVSWHLDLVASLGWQPRIVHELFLKPKSFEASLLGKYHTYISLNFAGFMVVWRWEGLRQLVTTARTNTSAMTWRC